MHFEYDYLKRRELGNWAAVFVTKAGADRVAADPTTPPEQLRAMGKRVMSEMQLHDGWGLGSPEGLVLQALASNPSLPPDIAKTLVPFFRRRKARELRNFIRPSPRDMVEALLR